MSFSAPTNHHSREDDFLHGFDIPDEETRQFLGSLLASGRTPDAELAELRRLSLFRGLEEWDMLFECASALRERRAGGLGSVQDGSGAEASLLPFLDVVLTRRPVQSLGGVGEPPIGVHGTAKDWNPRPGGRRKVGRPRKNAAGSRAVSHFWGDDGSSDIKVKSTKRQADDRDAGLGCLGSGETAHLAGYEPVAGKGGGSSGAPAPENQETAHVTKTESTAVPVDQFEGVSASKSRQAQSPGTQISLAASRGESCSPPTVGRSTGRVARANGGAKSPFFVAPASSPQKQPESVSATPSPRKKKSRPPRGTVSSLPIPPLAADRFGLIQEELADDPFRLLIAVTFLIRTAGKAAIPVFRQLMERFPTAAAVSAADPAEIIRLIHPLGLSAVRCAVIQKYARLWLERPPTREVRYGVKNYPRPGDGRHVRSGEEFGPEDHLGCNDGEQCPADAAVDARRRAVGCAWEIGHFTQGPYALDSWRIFCRDVLLGRSRHWTGLGSPPDFQPEWMRVLPRDKELRACLRWMWMREGWEWDPLTGEREPLREEVRTAVDEGRVGYDECGNLVIVDQGARCIDVEAGGTGSG